MNNSVLRGLNLTAEIYGREPFSVEAAILYRQSTGCADDQLFLRRLAELLKVSKTFPVPADFSDVSSTPAPKVTEM